MPICVLVDLPSTLPDEVGFGGNVAGRVSSSDDWGAAEGIGSFDTALGVGYLNILLSVSILSHENGSLFLAASFRSSLSFVFTWLLREITLDRTILSLEWSLLEFSRRLLEQITWDLISRLLKQYFALNLANVRLYPSICSW